MDFYRSLGDWQGGAHTLGGICHTVCEEHSWLNNEAWHLGNVWHAKRALHMFQDMAPYHSLELGSPRGFWEYNDQDFVAWVSKLAKRWGGPCGRAPILPKLTMPSCGTWPWHLGVESDCEKHRTRC